MGVQAPCRRVPATGGTEEKEERPLWLGESRFSFQRRFYHPPMGYLKKSPNLSPAAFLTRWRLSARHEKKGISGARDDPVAV